MDKLFGVKVLSGVETQIHTQTSNKSFFHFIPNYEKPSRGAPSVRRTTRVPAFPIRQALDARFGHAPHILPLDSTRHTGFLQVRPSQKACPGLLVRITGIYSTNNANTTPFE